MVRGQWKLVRRPCAERGGSNGCTNRRVRPEPSRKVSPFSRKQVSTVRSEVVPVDYEFFAGARSMLVLRRDRTLRRQVAA